MQRRRRADCSRQSCRSSRTLLATARAGVCVCARARVLFSLSRSCARALSLLVSERERASEREFVRMLPSFGKEMRGRGREGMRGRGGRLRESPLTNPCCACWGWPWPWQNYHLLLLLLLPRRCRCRRFCLLQLARRRRELA